MLGKVLVVDDEQLIASTVTIILRQAGFNAVAAFSGEDAIQVASSFVPDLLLSDVAMDGMNGVEVAMKILEFIPSCKVLLISGQAGTMDVLERARALGFKFPVLLKPVPPRELLGRISQLLNPASC